MFFMATPGTPRAAEVGHVPLSVPPCEPELDQHVVAPATDRGDALPSWTLHWDGGEQGSHLDIGQLSSVEVNPSMYGSVMSSVW